MFVLQHWIWSGWWVVCYCWSFTAYKSFWLLFSEFLIYSWFCLLITLGAMTYHLSISTVDIANEIVQKLFYSEIVFHHSVTLKKTSWDDPSVGCSNSMSVLMSASAQIPNRLESKVNHNNNNYTSFPNSLGKARLT